MCICIRICAHILSLYYRQDVIVMYMYISDE
jgi:hypothetical protein